MLVLTRRKDQWLEIYDKAGNLLRIRVQDLSSKSVRLVLDDESRNFEISRPECKTGPVTHDS